MMCDICVYVPTDRGTAMKFLNAHNLHNIIIKHYFRSVQRAPWKTIDNPPTDIRAFLLYAVDGDVSIGDENYLHVNLIRFQMRSL